MTLAAGAAGSAWLMFEPVLWIGVIALLCWAAARLALRSSAELPTEPDKDSASSIAHRQFARGEIDAGTYLTALDRHHCRLEAWPNERRYRGVRP